MKCSGKELEALGGGIIRCRKCPLHKSRAHAVPGEGDPCARVMLVGEAPGEKEDLLGRPFMGRTGEFFTRFLQEAGLDRGGLFITSAVKCRPPENRNPSDTELSICYRAWLEKQIEALNPACVVLMGKAALRQVFGKEETLKQIHGSIRKQAGREYLITYHPTAGMRFPDVRTRMQEDFVKVREYACRNA